MYHSHHRLKKTGPKKVTMEGNPHMPQFPIAVADCTKRGPLTEGDPIHE